MSGGTHLTVPGTDFAPVHAGPAESSTITGRPRSGSQRSQRSQHSVNSQPSNDNANRGSSNDVDFSRQPTIRIQRQTSRQSIRNTPDRSGGDGYFNQTFASLTRRRSTSEPSRKDFATPDITTPRPARQSTYMPDILENVVTQPVEDQDAIQPAEGRESRRPSATPQLRHAGPNIAGQDDGNGDGEYDNQLVDFLDLVGK